MNATGWSRGLEVTGGGCGVVSHAGLVLLRQLADRAGLTAGLSSALPSPLGGRDRGRVFSDLACAIADGARVISDFRVMGDQRKLLGRVASVPTAWRALREIAAGGDRRRRKVTAAVSRARRHPWAQGIERHGGLLPVWVADRPVAPLTGLSTLGSGPARFETTPPVCYRAAWQLPGPDSHRQATTSLRTARSTMALRHGVTSRSAGARKIRAKGTRRYPQSSRPGLVTPAIEDR